MAKFYFCTNELLPSIKIEITTFCTCNLTGHELLQKYAHLNFSIFKIFNKVLLLFYVTLKLYGFKKITIAIKLKIDYTKETRNCFLSNLFVIISYLTETIKTKLHFL